MKALILLILFSASTCFGQLTLQGKAVFLGAAALQSGPAAGGGSSFDPDTDASLIAWYISTNGVWQDGGTTPAIDNSGVLRWDDHSGHGHHLYALGTAETAFFTNQLNGKPGIRFGTGNTMTNATAFSQPFALYVVCKNGSLGGFQCLTDGINSSARVLFYYNDSNQMLMNCGSAITSSTKPAANSPYIYRIEGNGASSAVWTNGVSFFTGNAGSQNPTGLSIGGTYDRASGGIGWASDVYEVRLYDATTLDATKKSAIDTRLKGTWGL